MRGGRSGGGGGGGGVLYWALEWSAVCSDRWSLLLSGHRDTVGKDKGKVGLSPTKGLKMQTFSKLSKKSKGHSWFSVLKVR